MSHAIHLPGKAAFNFQVWSIWLGIALIERTCLCYPLQALLFIDRLRFVVLLMLWVHAVYQPGKIYSQLPLKRRFLTMSSPLLLSLHRQKISTHHGRFVCDIDDVVGYFTRYYYRS